MAVPDFDPGTLSARLTIERPVAVADGQGGAAIVFDFVGHGWARIEPVAAATGDIAGAEPVTVTHRIWLRHRTGLAAGWRLTKGTRRFRVRSVHDPDGTARFLVATCEEDGR